MKVVYWHYTKNSWSKVWSSKDIASDLKRYAQSRAACLPFDAKCEEDIDRKANDLSRSLVMCDLFGGAMKMLGREFDGVECFLLLPLDLLNKNIVEACYIDKVESDLNWHKPNCPKAQIVVIEESSGVRYIYNSCTSYDFWDMEEGMKDFIYNRFGTINLGGWLLRTGQYDIIDRKFKAILQ